MSNHWIGYAMAEVTGEVCRLLDDGELSFNHARRLVDLMQDIVGKNDGNDYEMWYGEEDRCCICLRKCADIDLIRANKEYAHNDPRSLLEESLIQMYRVSKAHGSCCCSRCVKKFAQEQIECEQITIQSGF